MPKRFWKDGPERTAYHRIIRQPDGEPEEGYVPDRITKDIKELCPDDCYVFPDDTGESAGKSGTETFLEGLTYMNPWRKSMTSC